MHCSPFPPRQWQVQPQLERYRLVCSDTPSLPLYRLYHGECFTELLAQECARGDGESGRFRCFWEDRS